MSSDLWPVVRLGDVVEVVHGFAFKTRYASDEPAPYALFTRKNVALGGGFREDEPRYYHASFDERFLLEPDDLMVVLTDLSKKGDLLGLPAIVPRTRGFRYLHNQRVGRVVLKDERIDRGFLYALLRSPNYRQHVLDTASQTTVRDTAPSRLHAYTFRLAPLGEQKRIARVLDTLDDKIDSNRRLCALLEETVETMFRAQFVDFLSIDTGSTPDRWVEEPLAHLASVHKHRASPDLPYIGLNEMPRGSTILSQWLTDGAPEGQANAFVEGDILFGKLRPYFRKVGVAPLDGRCSTEILVLRPHDPRYWGFVLGHVASQSFIDHCNAVSRGTRMPRAEWHDAGSYRVRVPPHDTAEGHTRMTRAMFEHILGLVFECRTLSSTRDSLLAKLVSGEIRLPATGDLEEAVGAAANQVASAAS